MAALIGVDARVARAVRTGLAVWLVASAAAADEDGWQVTAEEQGVVVSLRPVAGRALPELRSVGEIAATPLEILSVVVDVPNHVEWRPDCAVSKTIQQIDAVTSVVYSLTDAPWPVADRELVTRSEVDLSGGPTKVAVRFSALDAPEVEGKSGAVRMERATGAWEIEAVDAARSRVRYTVDADPGGSLPGWLVSMQTKRNPLETLVGLRRRVEQTRGSYVDRVREFTEQIAAATDSSAPTP